MRTAYTIMFIEKTPDSLSARIALLKDLGLHR